MTKLHSATLPGKECRINDILALEEGIKEFTHVNPQLLVRG